MEAMETTIEEKPGLEHDYALTHKTIGEIRGLFFVPSYQRGYRWDRNDVLRLLEDIADSKGHDYSLQPIVVKLHKQGKSEAEHEWELIDGQQRLTTLYLIMRYMQKQLNSGIGAPYKIRYETRPGSGDYLDGLDEALHGSNIDYYHLFQANKCIDEWFQTFGDSFRQNNVANTIHGYLFRSVRVIWYEAPAKTSATELFTRLNVGRIPLTDAELIKAALLSESRIRSADRAHEIAAQWDSIEHDLHHPDTWAFVSGLAPDQVDERYPTRISLLLDTLADEIARPASSNRPRYYTFDTLRAEINQNFSGFWKKVVALHAQIQGWVELPNIHNKIGFLVANGDTFGELAHSAKGKKKSEFDASLIDRIRRRLKVEDLNLEDLNYEDRKRGYPKLLQLLLLMNVETATQSGQCFPFARHVGQKWSLEHIHAQNAETLNRAEHWNTWLMDHKSALDAVISDSNRSDITQIKQDVEEAISKIAAGKSGNFSGNDFAAISTRVLKFLNIDDGADHSIRNMALLSSSDNSRLNNSVFEVKRQMILSLDRKGEYVPICTRNVFLKYYTKADAQQPHFWSDADKGSYLEEVRNRLKPYLL